MTFCNAVSTHSYFQYTHYTLQRTVLVADSALALPAILCSKTIVMHDFWNMLTLWVWSRPRNDL